MAGISVYAPGTRLGDSRLPSAGQRPVASQPLTGATQNPINFQGGTLDQIQQSPDWLQTLLGGQQMQDPSKAGYYDPSLQMRDLYRGYGVAEKAAQYGDSFYNPYFLQDQNQWGQQAGAPGFNPLSQNLTDYRIQGPGGDVYSYNRDPFSGQDLGGDKFYKDYQSLIGTGAGIKQFRNELYPYLDNQGMGAGGGHGSADYWRGQYRNQYATVGAQDYRREHYIYDNHGNVIGVTPGYGVPPNHGIRG